MNRTHLALLTALSLSGNAFAASPPPAPVFIEGSQYSAVLQQGSGHWRLTPANGQDLRIPADEADCGSGHPTLPSGIWLLTREADGSAALLAPSVTRLPPGHPDRVPLRDCDSAHEPGPALHLPRPLLDWIAQSSGAVLLTD